LNGADSLAITKLDVLDGMKELLIGVGYTGAGQGKSAFPQSAEEMGKCRPIYRRFPGWAERTSGVRRYRDLPPNARRYIEAIEGLCGARAGMISVGAERSATIVR
jgi:adenylosuccinate synthase